MKLLLLLSTLFMASCQSIHFDYNKTDNGIQCFINQDTLCIDFITENIIQVSCLGYKHSDTIHQIPFVHPQQKQVPFSITEKGGTICMQTSSAQVCVSPKGGINFRDKNGKTLLSAPIFSCKDKQVFQHPGQALYGLGQFQNGLFNLKGVPLRLQQYNQEIANPFVVSTNGYGLLWENTSITDVNYPQQQIDLPFIADSVKNIRYATFTPQQSGRYTFAVENIYEGNRLEGPVLLTIGNDTIIHYNTPWVPEFHSGETTLKAGKTYEIKLQDTGASKTHPSRVLYNEPDYDNLTFQSRYGNTIRYYMIVGTPAEAISGYRQLTGKAPLFEKWVFGFWQCRERYHNQKELLDNAIEYRKRKIPVDNIVQDWNYWPAGTWGPEWDRKLYPDPQLLGETLRKHNFHWMVSVWPRIDNPNIEQTYKLKEYQLDGSKNLDFFNPVVGDIFYRILSDSIYAMGVNSIWLDGTEPEAFPEHARTYLGDMNHNALAYSYMVTKSVFEHRKQLHPEQRVFNLTRSGFAGQQAFGAAVWSGDVLASWEQFREQITAGLNLAMSGIPYWTTDIGGFFRDQQSMNSLYDNQHTNPRYIELLTRWFQFGTFCPLFRIHGYCSDTEVWRYGADFEAMARKFINLRYLLLPYIYSEAAKVTLNDELLMRPLPYEYPTDTYCQNITDQFLFGSSILVCPVTHENVAKREVYLPEGQWIDFWTGKQFEGNNQILADAPLERLPLFIKAGAIIPVGPQVQYAAQQSTESLKIVIYPGANGNYVLYEDEGISYRYENGAFSLIRFEWDDAQKQLTIHKRQGEYPGMLQERQFEVILMKNGQTFDQLDGKEIIYTGKEMTVNID